MEFRGQDDDMGMPTSLGYNNPPPIRGSAFSKPSPSLTSSSLHSPRGGAGGGGGGGGGTRNGNLIGNPTPPPLNPNPTIVDSNPSHNLGNNPIPAPIPISSPPTGIIAATPNPKSATATNDSQVSSVATAADAASSRYRECLRNHAAAMGGHVVDGCGEFMPAGSAGTPGALKCAACGCHRSFHRREFDGVVGDTTSSAYYRSSPRFPLLLPPPHPLQPHQHQKQYSIGFPSTPSPAAVAAGSSAAAAAFGGNTSASGGTTTESSSEERVTAAGATPPSAVVLSKKRVRTRFTPEQKEKMLAFAARVGWRIHKQDEALVQQFCAEIGVRRQVLKVWMHNNKHTARKQQQEQDDQRQLQLQQQQQQQQPPQHHHQQAS